FKENPKAEVVTPVYRLDWDSLDALREAKKVTPYSGTTAIFNAENQALWFSKNIIPVIREEEYLRTQSPVSPVYQHIGLYGFRPDILEKFCSLDEGVYEKLEGLEQLRMLENGIRITTVEIDVEHGSVQSGIDSPEDIERAEKHIAQFGELVL
ncbi:MAG: 3-deoxy-manno-octulosonate cytidylyltransferase, partial [Alphaproteobacteria bacterium]|nr:3-deoxy-manno-octulosonate cytidylyltransferase [Alphaproteobacteria bacterium]